MTRSASAGFTVIEAVIALTVIALVAGALLAAGPVQIRGAADAFRDAAALRLAEADLEHAAAAPETLRAGVSAPRTVASPALDAPTVERHVRERAPGLLAVRTVVRWSEPGGVARELALETLVAREVPR